MFLFLYLGNFLIVPSVDATDLDPFSFNKLAMATLAVEDVATVLRLALALLPLRPRLAVVPGSAPAPCWLETWMRNELDTEEDNTERKALLASWESLRCCCTKAEPLTEWWNALLPLLWQLCGRL